jgi:anthranilate phosphoribosyltransferase
VFNLVGPLANPAGVNLQLIGVGSPEFQLPMAQALRQLGTHRAAIVHGFPILDEVSLQGQTNVLWIEGGKITSLTWQPEDFGLPRSPMASLYCASPQHSAERILRILQGLQDPATDYVLANAAAGLLVAGQAKSLTDGVQFASQMVRSGLALRTLERLKHLSHA